MSRATQTTSVDLPVSIHLQSHPALQAQPANLGAQTVCVVALTPIRVDESKVAPALAVLGANPVGWLLEKQILGEVDVAHLRVLLSPGVALGAGI